MAVDRDTAILASKIRLSKDVSAIACKEAFNPSKANDKEWSDLYIDYLLTMMIEDTDGQTLPAKDRQCIINKISGTL